MDSFIDNSFDLMSEFSPMVDKDLLSINSCLNKSARIKDTNLRHATNNTGSTIRAEFVHAHAHGASDLLYLLTGSEKMEIRYYRNSTTLNGEDNSDGNTISLRKDNFEMSDFSIPKDHVVANTTTKFGNRPNRYSPMDTNSFNDFRIRKMGITVRSNVKQLRHQNIHESQTMAVSARESGKDFSTNKGVTTNITTPFDGDQIVCNRALLDSIISLSFIDEIDLSEQEIFDALTFNYSLFYAFVKNGVEYNPSNDITRMEIVLKINRPVLTHDMGIEILRSMVDSGRFYPMSTLQ
jgi:hypothetical protein